MLPWLHAIPYPDIDPVFLRLGPLQFRWYGLMYLIGLTLAYFIIGARAKAQRLPLDKDQVYDMIVYAAVGVFAGGRLGYVLFYNLSYYLENPLKILAVWEGGMSFHGGFLGVVAAGLWFARRQGVPAMQLSDAMALVAPIGLFFGRLANFVNAELWGRPTDLPWGVVFPGAAAQDCPGIAPGLCARHPSQLYEAGLEGLLLGLLLWLLVRGGALKRRGLVTGLFLAGYGAARFAVEFVRQADAQFITPDNPLGHALHLGGFGLSMGQILSLPMILAGIWLIGRARRA